jgi:hypothetical protein
MGTRIPALGELLSEIHEKLLHGMPFVEGSRGSALRLKAKAQNKMYGHMPKRVLKIWFLVIRPLELVPYTRPLAAPLPTMAV